MLASPGMPYSQKLHRWSYINMLAAYLLEENTSEERNVGSGNLTYILVVIILVLIALLLLARLPQGLASNRKPPLRRT